jgi:phosphatidylglycerol:prolipoprotein diacylglycerol transferase
MHPVLFDLFGYPVHLYAVMIALGFVFGIWLAVSYGEKQGLDRAMLLDLGWWIIVSGLVGSRLAFIVVEWKQYYYPCFDVAHFNTLFPDKQITEPDCTRILRFWNGGLVFYGGVIGAMLTIVWFLRREKVAFAPVGDALIPSLALGQFFGRLGCYAAGCCFGVPSEGALSVHFPAGSMPYDHHLKHGLIDALAPHSAGVHPVQLYDAFGGLALCLVLLWIRRRKTYHGQVFVAWLFLYPIWRAIVELFRGDTIRGHLFEVVVGPVNDLLGLPAGTPTFLSTSQTIGLGMLAVGVVVWRRYRTATLIQAPKPG